MNTLDDRGYTPFLAYLSAFTSQHPLLFQEVQYRVNQQSFLYGADKASYSVTNADVFDKFADKANYYTYNYNVSQEDKNALTHMFVDKVLVQPFVKVLQFLVGKGAQCEATVGKLRRYREKEEVKQREMEEDKVKKREEKLEELRKRGKKRAPMKKDAFGVVEEKAAFDKINGQKVEREYGEDGMRNAIHILV